MEYYLDGMTEAELKLYKYLQKFENEKFIVFPNLMIERKELGTNQYDFILLTDRGIFVIEYKDYKGAIYGNEYSKNWKVYYKNGYNKKLRNPVKQNENHIKTLKDFLNLNNYNLPIFNIVVFGDKSSLKKIQSSVPVMQKEDIIQTVNKNHRLLFEDEDILKKIKGLLLANNITNPVDRKKHLDFVNMVSSNQNSGDNGKHTVFKKDYINKKENINIQNMQNKKKSKKLFVNKKFIVIGFIVFLWLSTSLGNDGSKKNIDSIENDKTSDLVSEESENNINSGNDNIETEDELNQEDMITSEDNNVEKIESIQKNKTFLDIGVSKEKVELILGKPTKKEDMRWSYSSSIITFNKDGEVDGWTNNFNQLDSVVYKPLEGAEKLKIGLTKEEVRELYGSPTKIINRDPNTWHYVNSNITFDTEGKVEGWVNNYDQLSNGTYKPREGATKLEIGLTKEQVRELYGSPTKIINRDPNTWYYANSNITFDSEGKVNGWLNNYDQLSNGTYKPIEEAEKLEIGLTKEQVRNLYGSPTKIINRAPNTWHYVNSNITFDSEGKVNGWLNNYDQLSNGTYKPIEGAEKLEIGLTKEEVRDLYGSPTKIINRDPNTWYYVNSKIIFSSEGNVSDWINNYGQLDSGL